LAVLSCVLMPLTLSAHPNHGRKVLGTVAAITADQLTVKDAKGKETTIALTKDTKIVRSKKAAELKDVTTGTRVVVTASTEKEQLVAQQIDITPAAATAAAH
jgi:hypothetical protein